MGKVNDKSYVSWKICNKIYTCWLAALYKWNRNSCYMTKSAFVIIMKNLFF